LFSISAIRQSSRSPWPTTYYSKIWFNRQMDCTIWSWCFIWLPCHKCIFTKVSRDRFKHADVAGQC